MARHTYRIDLAYDGSAFAGFQQQRGQRTVESELLAALRPFVPDLPRVAVGGRTDKGVHAAGQVVSFWSRAPLDRQQIRRAIEMHGGGAIDVHAITEVPRSFHATFCARSRVYRYAVEHDADVEAINAMLHRLRGERSFHAYARRTPPEQNTVLRLIRANAHRQGGTLRFELEADRFLRRMVRVLVATALREATGEQPLRMLALAEGGERQATAPPAPPDGLTLWRVNYEPLAHEA